MSQGADLNLQPDQSLPERSNFDPAHYSTEELKAFVQQLQSENAALKQQINGRQQADESRLRIVLENMPVMLFAIDEEGRCIAWNKESERITGYSQAEVLGLKYE